MQNPRLAVATIMAGCWDDLLCTLGVCCSSWVAVNRGTSRRSEVNAMGDSSRPSVQSSNLMVSRSATCQSLMSQYLCPARKYIFCADFMLCGRVALLLLLIHVANGVFILENPASSLIFKHDRMIWLIQLLGKFRMMVA